MRRHLAQLAAYATGALIVAAALAFAWIHNR